jgi:hypothetical protein
MLYYNKFLSINLFILYHFRIEFYIIFLDSITLISCNCSEPITKTLRVSSRWSIHKINLIKHMLVNASIQPDGCSEEYDAFFQCELARYLI